MPLDRISSYSASFHGTMDKYGDSEVANCASCHGTHAILPSSDPKSTVHKKNLPKTCGKCHENVGKDVEVGSIHMNPAFAGSGLVYWVRIIYIYLIIFTVFFLGFHNFLDFRKKMKFHYLKTREASLYERFTPFERVQHFLLAFSFIGFVITGFAIAYPDSWVAYPFRLGGDRGGHIRWWSHRILATIMIAISLVHLYYAVFTKRGRGQIKSFFPRWIDAVQLYQMVSFNLGLRKERPQFDRYSYIEKMEYLGLVWGTVVMVGTGLILTFNNLALKYLSMVAINVSTLIHLYEAILATLVIIVWHMYFAIFDPDEYPMNWTWRTGKLTEHQKECMHAGEEIDPIGSVQAENVQTENGEKEGLSKANRF